MGIMIELKGQLIVSWLIKSTLIMSRLIGVSTVINILSRSVKVATR